MSHEQEVRPRLMRDVCCISDEILHGRDERIEQYETSDDPMQRAVRRNPPYLEVVEAAYEGDRAAFADALGRSQQVFDEAAVERLDFDGDAIERALALCPFNDAALHGAVALRDGRPVPERQNLVSLLDFATRNLCLNPGNPYVRITAASAANLLGWHEEAYRLLDLQRSVAMFGGGVPMLNYLASREHADALLLLLDSHMRSGADGLPGAWHSVHGLDNLKTSITAFGIWSKATDQSSGGAQSDELRGRLYAIGHRALTAWATHTGRIEAEAQHDG